MLCNHVCFTKGRRFLVTLKVTGAGAETTWRSLPLALRWYPGGPGPPPNTLSLVSFTSCFPGSVPLSLQITHPSHSVNLAASPTTSLHCSLPARSETGASPGSHRWSAQADPYSLQDCANDPSLGCSPNSPSCCRSSPQSRGLLLCGDSSAYVPVTRLWPPGTNCGGRW